MPALVLKDQFVNVLFDENYSATILAICHLLSKTDGSNGFSSCTLKIC